VPFGFVQENYRIGGELCTGMYYTRQMRDALKPKMYEWNGVNPNTDMYDMFGNKEWEENRDRLRKLVMEQVIDLRFQWLYSIIIYRNAFASNLSMASFYLSTMMNY